MTRHNLLTDKIERIRLDRWDRLMREGGKFPCGDCGQMVTATELHTWDDCRKWEAAEYARLMRERQP